MTKKEQKTREKYWLGEVTTLIARLIAKAYKEGMKKGKGK